MKENDWKPGLYLKFAKERTQPSIDLVARINLAAPRNIIDIGCGPGNSTRILASRWPESKILGVDNSPAMIQKAKTDFPALDWAEMDANNLPLKEKYDIVFSNATIQWLPDHEKLLPNLWATVNDGGCLAVQIPLHHQMPISAIVEKVAASGAWANTLKNSYDHFTFHEVEFYYDALALLSDNFSLWETDYYHVMNAPAEIVEMMRATGMKPYLDKLNSESEKNEFEKKVLEAVTAGYPAQTNGKVLFPFYRLFFIAYK
jgi:trans-aconitate 2-methyltransferase